jgi:hypothetical protein
LAALTVASVAVLFAAACGGTDATEPDDGGGGFAAYTRCLDENGVTMTVPSGGVRPSGMPRPSGSARPGNGGGGFGKPAGVDDSTWAEARSACAPLRPSGRPDGGGPGRGADPAYRNCLRDHGVSAAATPDPAAARACEVLKPS